MFPILLLFLAACVGGGPIPDRSLPFDAVGVHVLDGGWIGVCTVDGGAVFARRDFSTMETHAGTYSWSRANRACAADGDRLYWKDAGDVVTARSGEPVARLYRPLFRFGELHVVGGVAYGVRGVRSGSGVVGVDLATREETVVSRDDGVLELRVRAGVLWWGSVQAGIHRRGRDSGEIEQIVADPTMSFGVGPDSVVWIDNNKRARARRIAGGPVWELVGVPWTNVLVVTGDAVFFAEGDAVRGVPLDGSRPPEDVVRVEHTVDALATDGEQLFFTAKDRLYRRPAVLPRGS